MPEIWLPAQDKQKLHYGVMESQEVSLEGTVGRDRRGQLLWPDGIVPPAPAPGIWQFKKPKA